MATEANISRKVRELRQERGWTQSRLAAQLELSQGRLSEIERGSGSFTAQQFLTILRIFNVGLGEFTSDLRVDRHAQLQNAIARLGGSELHESDRSLPSERIEEVRDVVREALLGGNSRLIAALAPVVVANIDRIGLEALHAQIANLGFDRRLTWLADNLRDVTKEELARANLSPRWRRQLQRANVVLDRFVEIAGDATKVGSTLDILDSEIRSKQTLDDVWASASKVSRRWKIVTSLTPKDFRNSLRAADVAR